MGPDSEPRKWFQELGARGMNLKTAICISLAARLLKVQKDPAGPAGGGDACPQR